MKARVITFLVVALVWLLATLAFGNPRSLAGVPVESASVQRWRPIVEHLFDPGDVDRVLTIIACESTGDPNLVQAHAEIPAVGLMQFKPIAWRTTWRWWTGDPEFWRYRPYQPGVDHPVVNPRWRTNPHLSLLAAQVFALEHPHGGWDKWACNPKGHP